MIRTEHVCKIYRGEQVVRAVDDVTLQIRAGEFVALTGPSGSGKTTLLSLLGALARPSSGTIEMNGRELSSLSDFELARLRRKIGFVFQSFSLVPRLPVWENVTYPLIPRGMRAPERYEAAGVVLKELGLAHKMHSRPEQLSGGEKQRVAVARALVGKPELLLADEPTSQLDPGAANVLADAFEAIHASGITMILSTHQPELLRHATMVLEMNEGKLTCCPTATDREQPVDRS